VIRVEAPGEGAGTAADGAVTSASGAVLAVHTADCAPVILVSPHGVAAVHAGWRGLAAGVVPQAVEALRRLGEGPIAAWVGPRIGPECYEFGAADLDRVAEVLGDDVRSRTAEGAPALDLLAAVLRSLAAMGVTEVTPVGECTACGPGLFSHRARGEAGRQVGVVWIEP
jgi:YfiH family protein